MNIAAESQNRLSRHFFFFFEFLITKVDLSTDITTTIPPSQAVFSVSTDIPPTTKRTTSSPLVVGKEAQMGGGMSSGRLVAIIVVVIAVIVVTILILLCLVHKKR